MTRAKKNTPQDLGDGNYDEFSGYGGSLFAGMSYDQEDEEADRVYNQCDVRMDERRAKWREARIKRELKTMRAEKPTIQQQFADLRRDLGKVLWRILFYINMGTCILYHVLNFICR